MIDRLETRRVRAPILRPSPAWSRGRAIFFSNFNFVNDVRRLFFRILLLSSSSRVYIYSWLPSPSAIDIRYRVQSDRKRTRYKNRTRISSRVPEREKHRMDRFRTHSSPSNGLVRSVFFSARLSRRIASFRATVRTVFPPDPISRRQRFNDRTRFYCILYFTSATRKARCFRTVFILRVRYHRYGDDDGSKRQKNESIKTIFFVFFRLCDVPFGFISRVVVGII